VTLWRVTNHSSLDGTGGLLTAGRWHSKGRPILYCATSPAAALLETLVHLEIDPTDVPATYRLQRVEVPPDTSRETIELTALPAEWRNRPDMSRTLGDAWLVAGRSALLEVPSALVGATANILVNPLHRDAHRLRIVDELTAQLDPPRSAQNILILAPGTLVLA